MTDISFKMVRDGLYRKIPGKWRVSPDPVSSLIAKLGEEYGEFAGSRDPAELYDMADAITELMNILDPDTEHWAAACMKRRRLGRFSRHYEWCPDEEDAAGKEEEESTVRGSREGEGTLPRRVHRGASDGSHAGESRGRRQDARQVVLPREMPRLPPDIGVMGG